MQVCVLLLSLCCVRNTSCKSIRMNDVEVASVLIHVARTWLMLHAYARARGTAFAKGGAELRVRGEGFQSGGTYYCSFRERAGNHRSVWSLADILRPQTSADMPQGGLRCLVPTWLFPAQDVNFSVRSSPHDVNEYKLVGDASQSKFTYLAGWDLHNSQLPTGGAASGGTLLDISTFGLNMTSREYACKFSHGQHAMWSPATPFNVTLLKCKSPAWGSEYAAVKANFSIYHAGAEMPHAHANNSYRFRFIQVWNNQDIEGISSSTNGGQQLLLTGYGFSSQASYYCHFSSDDHIASGDMSSAINATSIRCSTPPWPSGHVGVTMSLFRAGASFDVTGGGGLGSYRVQGLGTHNVTLLYTWGWSRVSHRHTSHTHLDGAGSLQGLAGGNELMSIYGAGFRLGSTYQCAFSSQSNESRAARALATVLNSSHLSCQTPAWGKVENVRFTLSEIGLNETLIVPGPDGTSSVFRFLEEWHYVTTHTATNIPDSRYVPVSGNIQLDVHGQNFEATEAYQCLFSLQRNMSLTARTNATVLNRTLLRCLTPSWAAGYTGLHSQRRSQAYQASEPVAAEVVDFLLVKGLIPVSYVYDSGVGSVACGVTGCVLEYLAEIQSIELSLYRTQNVVHLMAQGNQSVIIIGNGFSNDTNMRCFFDSDQLCTADANIINATHAVCVTRPCQSNEPTAMLYISGLYTRGIISDESVDMFYDDYGVPTAAIAVRFQPSFTSFIYSGDVLDLVQGLESIEIVGYGLGISAYSYNCTFRTGDMQAGQVEAVAVGNSLCCRVPRWSFPAGNVTIGLTFEDEQGAVSSMEFTGPIGGNVIQLRESISSIEPTSGSAYGGTFVTVLGAAFETDIDLLCSFERTGSKTMTSVAQRISALEIRCPLPNWGLLNAGDQLTGERDVIRSYTIELGGGDADHDMTVVIRDSSGNDLFTVYGPGSPCRSPAQVSPTTVSLVVGESYQIIPLDLHGDGWNGGSARVMDGSQTIVQITSQDVLAGTTELQEQQGKMFKSEGWTWRDRLVSVTVWRDTRFRSIDVNNDGSISYPEFKAAATKLGYSDLDEAQLSRLFNSIDLADGAIHHHHADDDMSLSLDEFWRWAPGNQSILLASSARIGLLYSFFTVLDTPQDLVPPVVLPSGMSPITIRGAGFDAHAWYNCSFSCSSASNHTAQTSAKVINTTHVSCMTVSWHWPTCTDGVLELLLGGKAIPFGNSVGASFGLSIPDVFVRLVPSRASAGGGSTIQVHGYAFDRTGGYRCIFGGVQSPTVTVKSSFVLECVLPFWPNASTTVSFQLFHASGRQVDRMGVRGALEYVLMAEPYLPFFIFEEAISIHPGYMDRSGGTDNGHSPAITVTGAGFDTSKQYRCQIRVGDRHVQSLVTMPSSSSSLVCLPPEWDIVTRSHQFPPYHGTVEIITSSHHDRQFTTVFSQPLTLLIVNINKVPWFTVERRSGNGFWVTPMSVNISEPLGDASRDFSFKWATQVHPGSVCHRSTSAWTNSNASGISPDPRYAITSTLPPSSQCGQYLEGDIQGLSWEDDQNYTFSVRVVAGGFFEVPPSVDKDGRLSFRLGPHAWGFAHFEVSVQDDGGLEYGGIDTSLPVRFDINVVPQRKIPTFVFESHVVRVFESAGPLTVRHFIKAISTGPALEFMAVSDSDFNVSTSAPEWFKTLPKVTRQGVLTFELKPYVFGRVWLQVSLTAHNQIQNTSRTNVQDFVIDIKGINNAPSFSLNRSMRVLNVTEDTCTVSSPCRFPHFVSQEWAGPNVTNLDPQYDWDERTQGLSFLVSEVGGADASMYFTQQPRVEDSELSFAIAADFSGTIRMNIRLKDDGGAADGGTDISDGAYFEIHVLATNDPPRMRLNCPPELTNPKFATLECAIQCHGTYNYDAGRWEDETQLVPDLCKALVTVQQTCLDCDERYRFVDDTCIARYFLPGFVDNIGRQKMYASFPAGATAMTKSFCDNIQHATPTQQAYCAEEQQALSFVVTQVDGDNSTFVHPPAIDASNGTLTFCLSPGHRGVNIFSVMLHDDGYMSTAHAQTSVPLSFGPFELIIITNPVNHPPQFRFGSGPCGRGSTGVEVSAICNGPALHVWENSGHNVLTDFAIDIYMSPLVNGQDPEAPYQTATFTIVMPAQAESLFTVRPILHANGTLEFTLAPQAVGVVLMDITLTDDGDEPPILYYSGDLGELDHAGTKPESYKGRNSSTQVLEFIISDALMQVRIEPKTQSAFDVAETSLDIAKVLSVSPSFVFWDQIYSYYTVAVGGQAELLQLAARVAWPRQWETGQTNQCPGLVCEAGNQNTEVGDRNNSGHLETDWQGIGDESETIEYKGRQYRALDGTSSTQVLEGCQRSFLPLPSGGWQVAEWNENSIFVISTYQWGTNCMHMATGESIRTASNPNPGAACQVFPPVRTAGNPDNKLTQSSKLLVSGPAFQSSYRPSACNHRVLISRPTPYQAEANTSLSYQGHACTAEKCSCSPLGLASTLSPSSGEVDCGCSCQVVMFRKLRSWSIHRRNFDHKPNFKVSRSIVLTGFDHPSTKPKVLPALVKDTEEPPFTLLSLEGVSLLEWQVEPIRYASEADSQAWVVDGTDGGVFAGAPVILEQCDPQCLGVAKSISELGRSNDTDGSNASVVIAQGSQRRNGVVEWRVTLVGQTANFSQSLSTEALLVLVVDDVIMMEDQDRDTRLFHLPQLLQTQTAPCAVKLRFAGDVQAQTTLSELDFSFDYSSYSGNTSILVTAVRPGCHASPPLGGMAFQGDGVCRDLKLQTKPDASGSISVHFTVKLGNFSHDYALRVLVLANNDAPAFRFNCSRTLLRHPAEKSLSSSLLCTANCGDGASTIGSGVCLDASNWLNDTASLTCGETCYHGTSCGVSANKACCSCGGGTRNAPLLDPRACTLTVTVKQLTPAERWISGSKMSNAAQYPYNTVAMQRECLATVQLEHAAVEISAARWLQSDELTQNTSFSVVPIHANFTRSFSHFGLPSIDSLTGNLTICLERGRAHGRVPFDVFLWDDGGTQNGGVNVYGPARLNVNIAFVNQEPSFVLCCGSVLHVIESSGHHSIPDFVRNMSKGERDASGVDLEESQLLTFVVSVSPALQPVAFIQPPTVHANGTLEFHLKSDFSGVVQVNISLIDDGGSENGGVNESNATTFDLVISSGYIEFSVTPPPSPEEDAEVVCELAQDLLVPCKLMTKEKDGVYRVMPGGASALVQVAQRALELERKGRRPFARVLSEQNEDFVIDGAALDENRTWDAWMLASGSRFFSQDCLSATPVAPSCQVNMTGLPPEARIFLSLDVVQTDFYDADEHLSSISAGDEQLGSLLLTSGGSDAQCNLSVRVLDFVNVNASNVLMSQPGAGYLPVRVTTPGTVGYHTCDGWSLKAKVLVVTNNRHVASFKVARYNLGNGVGSFDLSMSHLTITGQHYDIHRPLVLTSFITNITEPSDTELDPQGRARLVFCIRPIRFKPFVNASWNADGSDGGLFLGFQSSSSQHSGSTGSSQGDTDAMLDGSSYSTSDRSGSWYLCLYCVNESSADPGRPSPGPILVHRSHWQEISDGRISDISLTFVQRDPYLNGMLLCVFVCVHACFISTADFPYYLHRL